MPTLVYDKSRKTFVCACTFNERDIPRLAGFRWDGVTRCWHQPNIYRALRLYDIATETTKQILNEAMGFTKMDRVIITTPKNINLFENQKEAVRYILPRRSSYYNAKPGMGKTGTFITVFNSFKMNGLIPGPMLILVPPFLVKNTVREIKTFAVGNPTIEICLSKKYTFEFKSDITIVPDSLINEPLVHSQLLEKSWSYLVVDEAHRFKNQNALRTCALFGGRPRAKKTMRPFESLFKRSLKATFLSGTPMQNRPIELWPVLSEAAPWAIKGMNYIEYVNRYCDAKEVQVTRDKTALKVDGSSNEAELRELLKDFMLIHKKEDYLDLPEKIHIPYELTPTPKAQKVLDRHIKEMQNWDDVDLDMLQNNPEAFSKVGAVARMRKELGVIKADSATAFIENALEENDKIMVLTWHQDAQDLLIQKFRGICGFIRGSVKSSERDAVVQKFNNDKNMKLLFAQVSTAMGFNATVASRVIFVEQSWVPGENEQAEDRCHRIGSKNDVVVNVLSFPHDLDQRVIEANKRKQKTINKIMG